MELTVEQSCPSCAAAITLREEDRLLHCPFCGVANYRCDSGAGRYLLPAARPADVDPDQLLYIPYLRFRGTVYTVRDATLQHRLLDTTRLALPTIGPLPPSLGLRPQAMPLRPVVAATPGLFVRQGVPTRDLFLLATRLADSYGRRQAGPTQHRAFVGETLSRIYLPCYRRGGELMDAVTNRSLGPVGSVGSVGSVGNRQTLAAAEAELAKTCRPKASWEPRFLATICPHCAGLLSGERDSVVLHCRNCARGWEVERHRFVPVPWRLVPSTAAGTAEAAETVYLPFWRLTGVTAWPELQSFADYLRFTNQPQVVTGSARPLAFWIPAVKIQPKAFLQLAAQLTLGQLRLPAGEEGMEGMERGSDGRHGKNGHRHPVTLERREALESVKAVLAATTLARQRNFPRLREMVPGRPQALLIYLPFRRQTHDLVQEQSGASLQTAALRYGRTL